MTHWRKVDLFSWNPIRDPWGADSRQNLTKNDMMWVLLWSIRYSIFPVGQWSSDWATGALNTSGRSRWSMGMLNGKLGI
jgi:hypothetical protein